jgi:hypothetical protein
MSESPPDPHFLEKMWNKLSLEFIRGQADPVLCAYMRMSYYMGASVSLRHYIMQDEEQQLQARTHMSAEVMEQLRSVTAWLSENQK